MSNLNDRERDKNSNENGRGRYEIVDKSGSPNVSMIFFFRKSYKILFGEHIDRVLVC